MSEQEINEIKSKMKKACVEMTCAECKVHQRALYEFCCKHLKLETNPCDFEIKENSV